LHVIWLINFGSLNYLSVSETKSHVKFEKFA